MLEPNVYNRLNALPTTTVVVTGGPFLHDSRMPTETVRILYQKRKDPSTRMEQPAMTVVNGTHWSVQTIEGIQGLQLNEFTVYSNRRNGDELVVCFQCCTHTYVSSERISEDNAFWETDRELCLCMPNCLHRLFVDRQSELPHWLLQDKTWRTVTDYDSLWHWT